MSREIGIRAAAALLGVHANTVRNWINAGKLEATPMAGRSGFRRVLLADVERLERERARTQEVRVPEPVRKDVAIHRLQVKGQSVTAVRERVERRLNVETTTRPEGHVWAIYFEAPKDTNLDFLRPDVLPPKVEVSR